MPMLEEISDSLQLIDFAIVLIVEDRWFEEVCMLMDVSFSFL